MRNGVTPPYRSHGRVGFLLLIIELLQMEVKLFWDGKIDDTSYKLTTDWGALDAYHAPSRYGRDAFPSIPVADWTLDSVETPRNNAWFLVTLGARRGLTFLERQARSESI